MNNKLLTACVIGLETQTIEVEIDTSPGLFAFNIVGLAGRAVQEAKDRVYAAIKNSGFKFPANKRITINLAPADIPKSSPSYDLPIALAVLIASEQLNTDTYNKMFLGELSLDGKIRAVNGILPIADYCRRKNITQLFIPSENAREASLIPGLEVFSPISLKETYNYLSGIQKVSPTLSGIKVQTKRLNNYEFDMCHVKGQHHAKRALEIAAAGGHNILMSGTPGSGKSLLAKTLPSILPSLTFEESLESTKIYSVCGMVSKDRPMITERPFRKPHHTISHIALVGGGTNPKPGEISLAHRGILFLDELPEFTSNALEALRQPLEDHIVTISRAIGTITFPANFMLVAAMNPCKCGWRGDPEKECVCTLYDVNKYNKKISGPIMDRIDIKINVPRVKYSHLGNTTVSEESSELIRKRVEQARSLQLKRYEKQNIYSNNEMNQLLLDNIRIESDAKSLLISACQKFHSSARTYYKLIKVSQTIADLDSIEIINKKHILEAISFRFEDI